MERYDLLVVGGGIHGTGIARDAAGRGLEVALVERGDLGCATSSASSKLVHGGLRYLERGEFRLVREALAEREVLARAAPHLVRPMRFVMPYVPRLRPRWLIRAGLFLYDWLARREALPASEAIELRASPYGAGLKPQFSRGFAYSDCRVDDARLVALSARDAADRGARIEVRTACVAARQEHGAWRVRLRDARGAEREVAARALVNATGPWAADFLHETVGERATFGLRLVQGSHIVVPRLYGGDHAYILQNDDGRVIFVYGYERDYTLVGTTEVELHGGADAAATRPEEVRYLVRAVNRYFERQIGEREVVWSYCGVRALLDDGSADPSALTRDYLLRLDSGPARAPLLSVFGGKITTYRRLAERALERLAPWFPEMGPSWTARAVLPGGDFEGGDLGRLERELKKRYPGLPEALLAALARRHGALAARVLAGARTVGELGEHFGADLYAREVDYLLEREWASSAEDVLWRRTKAGLHLSPQERSALARYLAARPAGRAEAVP